MQNSILKRKVSFNNFKMRILQIRKIILNQIKIYSII